MVSPKKNTIAIVGGCGHVGLPLGIAFAAAGGLNVKLIDKNKESVDLVNRGKIHFVEQGGEELLQQVVGKQLTATTSPDAVRSADYVIFVTGTPLDEHLNPRVGDVLGVIDEYLPLLKNGPVLILRSTLFPGVSELIHEHIQKVKPEISVAFCPERVAQGFGIEEIRKFPQIISAFDRVTEDRVAELFLKIAPEVLRLTPKEAELTKLFANSWRYLEFAIANQHYMIAEASGVSFNRIYEALTYRYPRASTFRRSGFAAGPCLFKDTMQLSAFYDNCFFLGHAAMLINEGLPTFVVQQLEKRLGSLSGKRVGILGMSFKANNDDTRDSLSYKLKKTLLVRAVDVQDTDPYQPSASRLQEIVKTSDAIILGVPHREYLNLDLQGKPFVDIWGAWEKRPDLTQSQLPGIRRGNVA